jgi:hypothetical protein
MPSRVPDRRACECFCPRSSIGPVAPRRPPQEPALAVFFLGPISATIPFISTKEKGRANGD